MGQRLGAMAVRRPGLAVAALALLAVAIRAQSPVSMENAQLIKEEMGEEMADATAEQHEVALMGVNQHTKDMKECGVCVTVVNRVLGMAHEVTEKARKKEKTEKKKVNEELIKAGKLTAKDEKKAKKEREAAEAEAAANKPMDAAAEQTLIEQNFDAYCRDSAKGLEKKECAYLAPLKGTISEPVAKGLPTTALDMCKTMAGKDKDVCGKLMYPLKNPDDDKAPDPFAQKDSTKTVDEEQADAKNKAAAKSKAANAKAKDKAAAKSKAADAKAFAKAKAVISAKTRNPPPK